MKKICVHTGSRADLSPLFNIISILQTKCDLHHLMTEGLLGHEESVKYQLETIKPDMIVLLGDRYETLVVATVATLLCIPIVHIQGGEETVGAIDNTMRHAISKLSYWHFPIHQIYARRLIQMGENPERIFVCGAPGVDNLSLPRMKRHEIEHELGIRLKRFALVCFHPETLGAQPEITLEMMGKYQLIICGSNSDPGGAAMTLMMEQLMGQHNDAYYRESFGSRLWTGLMREADVLIGNSSSFIFEGMTLGKKVINVGDRQKGRYEDAVKLFSQESYPFGRPGTVAPKIVDHILSFKIPEKPRKEFYAVA